MFTDVEKNRRNKSEKTFQKMQKYVGMTAKKYSNKVYIGMAVCKGRGDDINT